MSKHNTETETCTDTTDFGPETEPEAPTRRYTKRSHEEIIADLEEKLTRARARATEAKRRVNPDLRATMRARRAIQRALDHTPEKYLGLLSALKICQETLDEIFQEDEG